MKTIKILYFLTVVCLVLNYSCVGYRNIERNVRDNNIFYSSHYPKIDIKINPDFKYIGKQERAKHIKYAYDPGGSKVEANTYTFCQIGDNKIVKKGVLIGFYRISQGYWLPDLFSNVKNKLDSGSVKIKGKSYQYAVNAAARFFPRDVKEAIYDRGYIISNCYLWKGLARTVTRTEDTKTYIYYFEDIAYGDIKYGCGQWQNATMLSDEQTVFLKEFIDRSEKNIQILGE